VTPARVGLRVRAGLPLSASAAGASPGPTRTSGLLRLSLRRAQAGLNTSNLLSPLSLRLSVIPTLPGTALVIPTQPEAELQAERGQARAVRVGPGRAPGRNRTTEAWLLVFRALVLTADFILHSVGCVDMVPGLQRPTVT